MTRTIPALRTGNGALVHFRFADPRDSEKVKAYFGSLSPQGRYDRFLGGMRILPDAVLEHFVQAARADRATMLATMTLERHETVIGEACYVLDAGASSVELALSVQDSWQSKGIGKSLVRQLEGCAAASGALRIFGDTLRSNERICGMARAFGYAPAGDPDGHVVRFEKPLAADPSAATGIGN